MKQIFVLAKVVNGVLDHYIACFSNAKRADEDLIRLQKSNPNAEYRVIVSTLWD